MTGRTAGGISCGCGLHSLKKERKIAAAVVANRGVTIPRFTGSESGISKWLKIFLWIQTIGLFIGSGIVKKAEKLTPDPDSRQES